MGGSGTQDYIRSGTRVYIRGEGWGPHRDRPYLVLEGQPGQTGIEGDPRLGSTWYPTDALTADFKDFSIDTAVRDVITHEIFTVESIQNGNLNLRGLLTQRSGVSRQGYELSALRLPSKAKTATWELLSDTKTGRYRLDPPYAQQHGNPTTSFMSVETCREKGYAVIGGPTKDVLDETPTKMLCGGLSVVFNPETKELTFNKGIGTQIPIELCVAIANKWGDL